MGKPGKSEEQQEDVFQAILLADNFGSSFFGPEWAEKRYPTKNVFEDDDDDEKEKDSTEDSPEPVIDYQLSQESLIPLGNRKLIDYSLEALTVSGVQEIFVYCSNGVNGGDALKQHIRKSKWSELPVKIHVISSEDCGSLGDALRDLDAKGMIRNDFILMSAGVVTNKALRPWLEMHRKTVKLDKGAVMTLIHRKIPEGHRSRSNNQNSAFVADSNTGKIIGYSHKVTGKRLKIPLENVKTEMEVVLDTVDTGIAVCSSSVLPLFTDNFDFSNMPDFIKNILMNEEVMGNTMYLHRLERGYANKIVDFNSFMGVSLDILQRWSYPLVPDMPFGSNPGDSVYVMGFNFVYKVTTVRAARDAKIGPAVLLGDNTQIGAGTIVKNSCIGNRCKIGNRVTITNSQIGNDVIVDDDCQIDRCMILDGTKIDKHLPLAPLNLAVGNQRFAIQTPVDEHDSESDDDDEESDNQGYLTDGSGVGEDGVGHQERDFKRFCGEVSESLHRGYTDNVTLDNLFIEIQGSRTANFMYFDDATVAVIKGIVGLAPKVHPDFLENNSVKAQWDKTKDIVVKFKNLLIQYVKNEQAQDNLLKTIEEYANDNLYFRPMIMQLLHYFYEEDVLCQESIQRWHASNSLYDAGEEIRKLVQKFIDWLETASESGSEESDD